MTKTSLSKRLLVSSVELFVQIPKLEVKSDHETPEVMVAFIADGCWTEACIQGVINKFLLKHMADAMGKENFVRKEWVDLLREMVLKLPEHFIKTQQPVMPQPRLRQPSGFNDIQSVQQHIMFKQLQELQRQQQLQQLSGTNQNSIVK